MKIRMMMMILAALSSIIGLAIEPCHAQQPNAGRLLEMYDHEMDEEARQLFEFTVSHIQDAFGWANAELRGRKTRPLYCAPPKLALTAPQLINILRKGIIEEPPLANPLSNQPLGFALLVSLQRAFPCPPN
jgi:hypothetical protein